MKFNCGLTEQEENNLRWEKKQERRKARYHWHRWFAWYPVQLGSHDCRWLEYVERRDINIEYQFDSYWRKNFLRDYVWDYRAIEK
jgi:hypothetical protein